MKRFFSLLWGIIFLWCCQAKKQEIVVLPEEAVNTDLSSIGKSKLSDYGFFTGDLKNLSPATGVIPYTINAALFTDYAFKKRFIKFPLDSKANYNSEEVRRKQQVTHLQIARPGGKLDRESSLCKAPHSARFVGDVMQIGPLWYLLD